MDVSSEESTDQEFNEALVMGRDKSRWFVQDPCGIACAVATYVFLVYGELLVLLVALPSFPTFTMVLAILFFTVLIILSFASHLKAMLTNPVCWGTPP